MQGYSRGAAGRRRCPRQRPSSSSTTRTPFRSSSPIRSSTQGAVCRRRAIEVRDEPVQLTYVEFELLRTMAARPGHVFTRQMLLEALWGGSAYREPRTIDVHVRHLREKLERDPAEPEFILTVRGVGYRFRDR